MKTEEPNAIQKTDEAISKMGEKLTSEELNQVSGGHEPTPIMPTPDTPYRPHFGDTYRCVECWYEIYDITSTTCLPDICPGCGSAAGWEPADL